MSLTKLDTARRIDPWPCSEQKRKEEFAKMQRYLEKAEDGEIPGFGVPFEATPTAAWNKGGGNPYVDTNLGRAFIKPHPARDPNIGVGQPVLVVNIAGVLWVVSDVLDDKIGTIKMWGSGAAPQGWALMNGSDNATGTGIDMRDRYPKGGVSASVGDTGGSHAYTPTGTIDGSLSGTISVTVDEYEYTGSESVDVMLDLSLLESDEFTIASHDSHRHLVAYDTKVYDPADVITFQAVAGTGAGAGFVYTTSDEDHLGGTANRDHQPTRAEFTESDAYETTISIPKSAWNHAHTAYGTVDSISGTLTFTGDEAEIDMPHAVVQFIERMDNSQV